MPTASSEQSSMIGLGRVEGRPSDALAVGPVQAATATAPAVTMDDPNGMILFLFLAGAVVQLCSSEATWMECFWGSSLDNSSGIPLSVLDLEKELVRLVSGCFRYLGGVMILILLRRWVATHDATSLVLGTRPRASPYHHHLQNQHQHQHRNNERFRMVQDLMFHVQCRILVALALFLAPVSIPQTLVDVTVLTMATCTQRVFSYPSSISAWMRLR